MNNEKNNNTSDVVQIDWWNKSRMQIVSPKKPKLNKLLISSLNFVN